MTMTPWAIIPMRGLRTGKQRLARALTPAQRESLNHRLLEGVLRAVVNALGGWQRCIVQSADPQVVVETSRRGGLGLLDRPGADLNSALDQARETACKRGAARLLVLSADLPSINEQAVRALLAAPNDSIILIADKTGMGTNGLLLPAAFDFRFEFGDGSLAKHWQECERLNAPALIWRSRALQFDLDTGDDLRQWREHIDSCPHTETFGDMLPFNLRLSASKSPTPRYSPPDPGR